MERKILDFSNQETVLCHHTEGKHNCALELVPHIFDLRNIVLQSPPVSLSVQGPEAKHLTQQPIRVLMKTNSNEVSHR